MDSSRWPWNKPHSSKRRWPLTSNRYIEPVVVRVAPKKWIFILDLRFTIYTQIVEFEQARKS